MSSQKQVTAVARKRVLAIASSLPGNHIRRRRLVFEPLDPRWMLAATPWQNSSNRMDANDDGTVAVGDVMVIINELNANGPRLLPAPSVPSQQPPPYWDTNGDNHLTALDVLVVVNHINDPPSGLTNIAVTSDPGVQQMPSVAVDPLDPQHVVIAYMDYSLPTADTDLPGEGYAGIGVAVSRDGGDSFQYSALPIPEPFNEGASNPIARFDDQGRVFVTFMAATFLGTHPHLTHMDWFNPARNASDIVYGFESHNGIFVARSDDGGLTWKNPTTVVSHLFDGQQKVNFEIGPEIAIDIFPSLPDGQPNPNYGNLYVAWNRIYVPGLFPGHPDIDGGADLMLAVSRDAGQTWETQFLEMIDDDGNPYLATVIQDSLNNIGLPGLSVVGEKSIAIGPAGEIYYSGPSCGDFGVLFSTDGGATFDPLDHATGRRIAFGIGCPTGTVLDPLPGYRFRKLMVPIVVADPSRPGRAYVVTSDDIFDPRGTPVGPDVIFARSDDYGVTWREYTLAEKPAVLNDDNDGRRPTGIPTDVTSHQVMPRVAIDGPGNVGVVWVDTRRDTGNHMLDVFGTISTDGGQTFRPNFRLTDVSFDADRGRFTNAVGNDEYYIGDYSGLAMANNTAYAAWTDTRGGNQDIYFTRYAIDPAPEALNDRFEPNDTAGVPTLLGAVVQRLVPKLDVPPGDEDWFLMQAAATGEVVASVGFEFQNAAIKNASELPDPGALALELWDKTGGTLLTTGSEVLGLVRVEVESGKFIDELRAIGKELRLPSDSGHEYLVRVVGVGSQTVRYSLALQSLTEDLGTRASVSVTGSITDGGGALYLVNAAAAGSMDIDLQAGPGFHGEINLSVFDPKTLNVIQLGQPGPAFKADSAEPNDSILEANPTGFVQPGSVTIDSRIGDGAFGATSGDFDFYRFEAEANNQVTIRLEVVGENNQLDSLLALYDASGQLLKNVDGGSTGSNETLTFTTEKSGGYLAAVLAFDSFPPADPFTPGTGSRKGSTGDFRLTITTEGLGPSAKEQASLPVRRGDSLLLLVSGADGSAGDFTLNVTNFDQFTTPEQDSLFYPTGAGPSQASLGDLNRDGNPDIVVTDVPSDTISVVAGNGDGTFQAPRQFPLGAFIEPPPGDLIQRLPNFGRDVAIADFNRDGLLDAAVTNRGSSDVSVLLGRSDGSFEPQRRFDATFSPIALESGDLNGDSLLDLAVVSSGTTRRTFEVSTLLGRGDGTFQPQRTIEVPNGGEIFNLGAIQIGDLSGDGIADLVISGGGNSESAVLVGIGDGTFTLLGRFPAARLSVGLAVADINGDGNLDILNTEFDANNQVSVLLGDGAGAFRTAQQIVAGQNPVALEVVDLGSQRRHPDGSTSLGPPDGHPDVVVAVSGVTVFFPSIGPPSVVVLPAVFDDQDQFVGLGSAIQLATAVAPQDVDIGDVNRDGVLDIVTVDRDGVLVIFGKQPVISPNNTPNTARDLGTVVHLVQPTLTIVAGHEDAYYKLQVPTEAVAGAGDEVLDFSGLFQFEEGSGLRMDVLDEQGNALGSGERFQVLAKQGEELLVHVYGVVGLDGKRGAGAYTLVIDVLPQVVGIQAESLLPGLAGQPGGPSTHLVLTLQGDRLDRTAAEKLDHYRVIQFGPDRIVGTADDRIMAVAEIAYNPGANVDVSSGLTFPTAVRQTVTLVFGQPLPAGSYRVELSPNIQTEAFNEDELALLTPSASLSGHPIMQVREGQIQTGSRSTAIDLVVPSGALGDLKQFAPGTAFLTQLHNDLGAFLDSELSQRGDDLGLTASLVDQVMGRLSPSLGALGTRPAGLFALVLDPVDIELEDLAGEDIVVYDLDEGDVTVSDDLCFVEVGGNIELIICAILEAGQSFRLNVGHVTSRSRGAAFILTNDENFTDELTDEMRNGVDGQASFTFSVP